MTIAELNKFIDKIDDWADQKGGYRVDTLIARGIWEIALQEAIRNDMTKEFIEFQEKAAIAGAGNLRDFLNTMAPGAQRDAVVEQASSDGFPRDATGAPMELEEKKG